MGILNSVFLKTQGTPSSKEECAQKRTTWEASEVFSAKEINIKKALSEFPTVPRMSRIQRGSTPSLFVEVLLHLQPAVSSWEEKERMEKLSLDKLLQGVTLIP